MNADSSRAENNAVQPVKIDRRSLHGEILTRLRTMIVEGDLAPGARINEVEICTQFGVSRTPLREALRSLASEGLVELVLSRGAVVREFSAKEVSDAIAVIRNLEEFACVSACTQATDAAIGEIRALHDAMEAAYEKGDRRHYYNLNQEIHTRLVDLADNSTLSQVHETLQASMKRFRYAGHEGSENWARAVAEHRGMIEALEARDPDRLKAVIGQHLGAAWERVADMFAATQEGAKEKH
ncbi:GntR family transcriptional regulator [Aliiruegeria sabulilitoris]|uniref:GntR family transcriptional regulator n=1 Tax=Aliiruegeria sabulilitoris TaxID=1510458 RepID=UPI0008378201|nr:GntR family transcriptional regulator [Aliiruegeria sabulilitoris]NDR58730.1 GntR family transcriptional regulator [Pseudoruegeria sp. M32A2M]